MKLQNNRNTLKVLVLGDVIGRCGRQAVLQSIQQLKKQYDVDLFVVNAENATHGNGLNYKHYQALIQAGCDVLTMGNHVFGNKEIYQYIKKAPQLIVPANLENIDSSFNTHFVYETTIKGKKVRVLNLLGLDNMKLKASSPFWYFKNLYEQDSDAIYIVDYHAELTAEKNSLGYYLDGKASLMFGTHTHVQTADERIMPLGMAYITDAGMCGIRESMIGFDYQQVLEATWNGTSYGVANTGKKMINGLFAEIDLETKKAIFIQRINQDIE